MKGFYKLCPDGTVADMPPCGTCKYKKHKNKMTVESPCYDCVDNIDLALHKPNAEIEFYNYEQEG